MHYNHYIKNIYIHKADMRFQQTEQICKQLYCYIVCNKLINIGNY